MIHETFLEQVFFHRDNHTAVWAHLCVHWVLDVAVAHPSACRSCRRVGGDVDESNVLACMQICAQYSAKISSINAGGSPAQT